jgi:peptidoglycan hydrolase-like protein with peptidoglycan-binding domain
MYTFNMVALKKKPRVYFQLQLFFPVFFMFFLFIPTFSFAQTEEGNVYLPEAPGQSNTGYEENLYLNNKPKVEQAQPQSAVQTVNAERSGVYEGQKLSCPYAFERDLSLGSRGEDVRLLQVLLNSGKRTLIAVSGEGSPGKETGVFGEATKNAVKRFQALFIEYIGVANGRFGPRTRTVMNSVCNGDYKVSSGQAFSNVVSVQANATPKGEITVIPNDKIGPNVSLSANLNTVKHGENFKIVLNTSEEVKAITPDAIILTGGTIKEIRKLSKTNYSLTITPIEDAITINAQVEAEKIFDLANNFNENASNEINVRVIRELTQVVNPNQSNPNTELAQVNDIINKVISSVPVCNYTPGGVLITKSPDGKPINTQGCPQQNRNQNTQMYNCYGRQIPVTQPCPFDPYQAAMQQRQQAQQAAQQQAQAPRSPWACCTRCSRSRT